MSGEKVKGYLRQLCQDLDEGKPLKPYFQSAARAMVVPAALAVGVMGLEGCGSRQQSLYAGPPMEICDDSIDNDGNGQTDCADVACAEHDICDPAVLEYGAPLEPPPDDPQPEPDPIDPGDDPGAVAEYMAPFEPDEIESAY